LQGGGTTKSVTPTTLGPPFGGFSIALSLLTVCILKNVNLQTDESTVCITPCSSELNLPPAFRAFLLRLLFDPEDGGDMFLRNVALSPNYTALQPKERILPSHSRENQLQIQLPSARLAGMNATSLFGQNRLSCRLIRGSDAAPRSVHTSGKSDVGFDFLCLESWLAPHGLLTCILHCSLQGILRRNGSNTLVC
jgi:hypothetical protein